MDLYRIPYLTGVAMAGIVFVFDEMKANNNEVLQF